MTRGRKEDGSCGLELTTDGGTGGVEEGGKAEEVEIMDVPTSMGHQHACHWYSGCRWMEQL